MPQSLRVVDRTSGPSAPRFVWRFPSITPTRRPSSRPSSRPVFSTYFPACLPPFFTPFFTALLFALAQELVHPGFVYILHFPTLLSGNHLAIALLLPGRKLEVGLDDIHEEDLPRLVKPALEDLKQ